MTLQCTYYGHRTRILGVHFSARHDLLVAVCREKKINLYTTNPVDENRRNPVESYTLSSTGMSVTMDELSRQCFVGDTNGTVHFLKIDIDNKCELKTKLKGHSGENEKSFIRRIHSSFFQEIFLC